LLVIPRMQKRRFEHPAVTRFRVFFRILLEEQPEEETGGFEAQTVIRDVDCLAVAAMDDPGSREANRPSEWTL
jgi:hypothetical protein